MWNLVLLAAAVLLLYCTVRWISRRARNRERRLQIRRSASTPSGVVPVIVAMYSRQNLSCSGAVRALFERAQNPYRVVVVIYEESDSGYATGTLRAGDTMHAGRVIVSRHDCEAPAGLLHALTDGIARVPVGPGILVACAAGIIAEPDWDTACIRSVASPRTVASGLPGPRVNFLCVEKRYSLPHVVSRDFPFPPTEQVPMTCVSAGLFVVPLELGRAALAAARARVPRGFPAYASDLILSDELFARGCMFRSLVVPVTSGTRGGTAEADVRPASWPRGRRRVRISKKYADFVGVDPRLRRVSGRARLGLLPSTVHAIKKYGSASRVEALRSLYGPSITAGRTSS